MNAHTQFKVRPGVYERITEHEDIVVVKTVVTHSYNPDGTYHEVILPLVVVEPLVQDIGKHRATIYSEEEFLSIYQPI